MANAIRKFHPQELEAHAHLAFGEARVRAMDIAEGHGVAPERRRGRGTITNASGRFETKTIVAHDDGWNTLDDLPPLKTEVIVERARTIIARNDSPDIGFDRSINPYRGCEHGCSYCFARPTHAYMGLSPGLDFETRLFVKPNAPELLERELSKAGYSARPMAMGTNTDPYQPVEREWRVTRRVLEVLEAFNHPVAIVTKSALVMRDSDILARMAQKGLAKVALSVTSLDRHLARTLEPRAATPMRRLEAIRHLSEAGIPTAVMVAPVIPVITDSEIERILDAAAAHGASEAGYILLRMPHEIRDLFREWLVANRPDAARHVLSLIQDTRGGKDYDARFGLRMKGQGAYAWTVERRFEMAAKRLGLNERKFRLNCGIFRVPDSIRKSQPEQLALF